jgi:hypothetical protein
MHTSACIDIFSSPARHSLIAMEPTILQIPIYALTTFHTVEEKVIPFPCKLVIWYRWWRADWNIRVHLPASLDRWRLHWIFTKWNAGPRRENSSANTITDILPAWRAPPHFTRNFMQNLNEKFPDRRTGRGGPQKWPPRSPALNPSHFHVLR